MNNSNPTTIVVDAIIRTRRHEPDHWRRCLEDRAGAESKFGDNKRPHLGSYLPRHTPESLDQLLEDLQWEIYTHPDVVSPAQAYIARSVPGRFGMVQLGDVPLNADLRFVASKDAGKVEVVWRHHGTKGIEVDFLVLLVGPGDKGNVVWTFHPGDPIRPSTVNESDLPALAVALADALVAKEPAGATFSRVAKDTAAALGVQWVKLG